MSSSDSASAAGVEGENQKPTPGPAQEGGEPNEELLIGIGTPTESEPSADVASVQQSNTSDLGPESSSSSSSPKRPREEDLCTNAAEYAVVADFTVKRQKAASTPGESMIEKLKTETEQLIENPEETLGPDLVQPGEQGISTFHDNDVLSGMCVAMLGNFWTRA
jgi:hypothetical protein